MAENILKIPQSATPARTGAGDISERGLSRERSVLRSTPSTRLQPAHPKKLFSTPVSKFTCRRAPPPASAPRLARLRSCLDQYARAPPAPSPVRAASMEDLTPTKRVRKESSKKEEAVAARSPRKLEATEAQAAARISRALLLAAWRRRRREALQMRALLDSKQSSCSRLRLQVWVLRSLLETDSGKVALAVRELERLKQTVRDRDQERALLEREKAALEKDLSAAEDRASELSIGWRNARNELEELRAQLESVERERADERAATEEARAQRDLAYTRISLLEEELEQHAANLLSAEQAAAELRREASARERALRQASERLRVEHEARARNALETSALRARGALLAAEAGALRDQLAGLRGELAAARAELARSTLTRVAGAVRAWLRRPLSLPEALVWALLPARHGCS